MAGITVEYNGKQVNFVNIQTTLERVNDKHKILLAFQMYGYSEIDNHTYTIIIEDERAKNFYTNWTNHSEIYRELCRELGVDESIVPDDMEDEVVA